MNLRISPWRTAYSCVAALILAAPAYAVDQSTESFDTNWPSELQEGAFTTNPVTNPVSQWVVNYAQITNVAPLSSPSVLYLKETATSGNAWAQTPQFTNGIGRLVFYARCNLESISYNVESSTNGVNWSTNASYTLSVRGTWTGHTNTFSTTSNLYLRIRKTTDTFGKALFLDNCSVTYLPAQLTVTNALLSPAAPVTGDGVDVTAQLSISSVLGGAPTLTTVWRDLFSPTWNTLGMASNDAVSFTTTSAIPSHVAGAVVEYYVRAVYDNGNGAILTNTYPASGASAPLSYTVRERSSFTNMTVQGAVNTNMLLVSPYQWQAAVPAVSLTDPGFTFRGASNAATVTWGDADQSIFALPAYGTAEISPSTITVAGAVSKPLSFRFNEQSGAYTIQPCAYDNLDAWANRPSGIYTNNGWVLSNGLITNDASYAFHGAYALLNGKPVASNSFFQSTYLTNGIGQVSFWFRSYATGGSPTGAIAVQKAASPTSTWTTIATTNTTSTNYLYQTVGHSDRDSHVLRILNNASGNDAPVCIDEIVICEPGAGVTYSNLLSVPAPATILDPVNIEVNIDAQGGATELQALTFFRFGTNGVFDTLAMTNDAGNHFITATPIPPSGLGTVQYFVVCSYTGFQSEVSSPAYLPSNTNNPASYTVQAPNDGRSESFDTNWPSELQNVFTTTPVTNPSSQWVVSYAMLTNSPSPILSSPNALYLKESGIGSNAWVQTPQYTNGIGSFIFYARCASQPLSFDLESSTNGVDWDTVASTTLTSAGTWVGYTNTFNTSSNLYFRIRKTTDAFAKALFIDNCSVTYPPSRVAISNVTYSPAHPSTADTVSVSCTVTSLNAMFPAVNFAPTLYYRKGGTAPYTAVTMVRGVGDQYTTVSTIPAFPRDTPVEYYVRCDFKGYYGSPSENQSPAFYPDGGASSPTNYLVRAFTSPYGVVRAIVNGVEVDGRLLRDRTWQAVALIENPTDHLTVSLSGTTDGTNTVTWGNTNNWQTALPLADHVFSNEAAFSISGTFKGQYVIRFNEQTGEYILQKCLWQDFDTWASSGGKYIQSANDSANPASLNFDSWTNNETRVRSESFSGGSWPSMTTYTNGGIGDNNFYDIYGSRIESVAVQGYAVRTKPNQVAPGQGFVVQKSDLGDFPLRGIGTITARYRPSADTPAVNFGIYLLQPDVDFTSYLDWMPVFTATGLTNNSAFVSNSVTLRTNQTYSIIFAHTDGLQSMYIDDLTVSEWYADTKTVGGWTAAESWIEPSLQPGGGKCCRFDVTRADAGALQYIQSPMMTNGVNAISFQYGGILNYPASFALQLSYGDPDNFTTVLQQTNTFSGTGSSYTTVVYTVRSDTNNIYVRLVNTTPSPGVLLVDNLNIGPYALPTLWAVNNAAIDASAQAAPPLARQFYAGACYLNSNRTSDVSTDAATKPFSNFYPYVRSADLDGGIGEVSFWYRNWAISGATVAPATLVIETSATSSTNDADWTPIAIITNIVNTNDYVYYRTSVYQPDSHYVRIYNNDSIRPVGRVCLDDILVTAPMAASLSMSNMVTIPQQPVYTDQVDVAVDLYNFFLAPSNLDVRTYYSVATNYEGLAAATPGWRMMSCIATNLQAPGQWYRYKTTVPIPTNSIDTFVRYWVTVRYDGLLSEISTPKTNQAFGVYPSWYDPMNAIYGTNMAYYVVYSSPPGSVWINEVNYLDNGSEYDKQFIELCGKAGISLKDWKIDIEDGYNGFVAEYVITNAFTLNNETNGHGFWVLGKPAVPNIDMELTNEAWYMDIGQSLPSWNGGRITLRRSWGAAEHKVAYESPAAGYEFIGLDFNSYYAGTASASGSGTNYGDFFWMETDGMTPGEQNAAQTLYDYTSIQEVNPPTITITDFWVDSSVWIVCTRTNGWYPAPLYTTNILDANSWEAVPVFARDQTETNAVINFTTPAGSVPRFYAVEATNAP